MLLEMLFVLAVLGLKVHPSNSWSCTSRLINSNLVLTKILCSISLLASKSYSTLFFFFLFVLFLFEIFVLYYEPLLDFVARIPNPDEFAAVDFLDIKLAVENCDIGWLCSFLYMISF